MTAKTRKSKMSVTQLTLLTALNMFGSGIIMLPAKIAKIGGISLLTWGIVSIAAIAMAYAFAYCGMFSKGSGGLGKIAENAFGRFGSFITNFVYATSLFLANGAIATSAVGYLCGLFDVTLPANVTEGLIILMLWTATIAILIGVRFTGLLGALSIWGIFIPVICLLTVAPFSFDISLFQKNWNPHNYTNFGPIQSAIPMMFWSFLGLESAVANADSVETPEKSVPKAVLIATVSVSILYIATTVLFTGLFPNEWVIGNQAPFTVAFTYLLGSGPGKFLSFCLFIAMWGSLMGWQFTMARVFNVFAERGIFPEIFKEGFHKGVPCAGLVLLVFSQTILVPLIPIADIFHRFDVLVDLSVVTTVFPYLTCMAAVFSLSRTADPNPSRALSARTAAYVGLFFLLSYFFFIDNTIMKFAFLLVLTGFILYGVFVQGKNFHYPSRQND